MSAAIGLQGDFDAVGLRRLARMTKSRTRDVGCWHFQKFTMAGAAAVIRYASVGWPADRARLDRAVQCPRSRWPPRRKVPGKPRD